MAQKLRQTRLFAAEDYMAVYDSYLNANFKAYDFDTIRQSMVEYIRETYPESFNDWVESADFVALLDVIAQFGHNLAFRLDLNTRNNILSTATRQDAVFRLAEFLGYKPKRNITANSELKIVSVKTTENVIGSEGTSLAGKELRYEATNNINNLDNFLTVLNAALSTTNQFGNPKSYIDYLGSDVQLYDLNNTSNQIVFEFSGIVQGQKKPFNIYSIGYDSVKRKFYEKNPNPRNSLTIMYKDSGGGVTSNNSGFFVGFKQGTLGFKDFNIDRPVSNLTLDIDIDNIAQDNVWVQTINESGDVLKNWTIVDDVFGYNEIYNNIPAEKRAIFSVKSRMDNRISILFPDSNFGELPKDIIRVWYRTSENQAYSLRPDDVGVRKINISYISNSGLQETLSLGVQLKTTVNNASAAETLDEIKLNAPRVYSAQDRMITADDYNNYLAAQSNNILKIKSINRTHSGHSRFVDLSDPSGTYSKVRLFATDGIMSKTDENIKSSANNISPQLIYENLIKPLLSNQNLVDFYYQKYKGLFIDLKTEYASQTFIWNSFSFDQNSGYMTDSVANIVGNNDSDLYIKYLQVGALVKFSDNSGTYWAKVANVYANGLGVDNEQGYPSGLTTEGNGAIVLDTAVPNGAIIDIIYPAFSRKFTTENRLDIIAAMQNREEFTIEFDFKENNWTLTSGSNTNFYTEVIPSDDDWGEDDWIICGKFNSDLGSGRSYDILCRTLTYTIESQQIEFSNTSNEYKMDGKTRKKVKDTIDIFINGEAYHKFYVYGYDVDENGVYRSDIVKLSMVDDNNDSRPDNPDSFNDIVGEGNSNISNLRFEWTHPPATNEFIDPSFSNIIDSFILTKEYDKSFRNWVKNPSKTAIDKPLEPSIDELNQQFYNISGKKSLSDTIVYRPVKYKVLFGDKATYDLRATFKIVKVPGTNYTDNDIKSFVVDAIFEYFDSRNWEFGETFYFTELAGFVHKKLSGIIGSFVIVPEDAYGVFGTLFQITPMSDELFIPDVSINDIEIIDNITKENIKAIG